MTNEIDKLANAEQNEIYGIAFIKWFRQHPEFGNLCETALIELFNRAQINPAPALREAVDSTKKGCGGCVHLGTVLDICNTCSRKLYTIDRYQAAINK